MNKPKILVVEDSVVLLDSIRLHLDLAGWNVETARNGTRALFKWKSSGFDCLLTDGDLPGLDGIRLTRYAMEWNPDSIFVMFSGDPCREAPFRNLGHTQFFLKPDIKPLLIYIEELKRRICG